MASTTFLNDYSLEITAKDIDALAQARDLIPPGSTISVTYLEGETTQARIAASAAVRTAGFTPMPHISARRLASAEHLRDYLSGAAGETGLDRVFVVAGDCANAVGPYHDSLALIRSGVLQAYGVRSIGICGYPEGHAQIGNETLWRALVDKAAAIQAAGLDCQIITQFGFDPEPILAWLAELRARGVGAPVRIGLPGPANAKVLLRFAARCGVAASAKVLAQYGLSMTRLLTAAGPDRLVAELDRRLAPEIHGRVSAHLYPFGGLVRAAQWARQYAAQRQVPAL